MEKLVPPQLQALVAPAKIPANPSVLPPPQKSSLEGTNRARARAGLAASTVSAGLAPRLRLALNPGLNPTVLEAWDFLEGSACFQAALGLPSDERLLHTHFCRIRSRWQEPDFLGRGPPGPVSRKRGAPALRCCGQGRAPLPASTLSFGEGQLSPLPCNEKTDEKNL